MENNEERFVPEYIDVTINRNTCLITKYYSDKPITYFIRNNRITINLKWPEGKSGYTSARSTNILAAYNKAFGIGFTGFINCSNENNEIVPIQVINGKVVNSL